jgi:phage-related minor tail protein
MTPDNEKHLNFILSRFKSGQINSGQVVREIEKIETESVQVWVTNWNHLSTMHSECQSELTEAKHRIAELEKELGIN